jgi:hypothetical protein
MHELMPSSYLSRSVKVTSCQSFEVTLRGWTKYSEQSEISDGEFSWAALPNTQQALDTINVINNPASKVKNPARMVSIEKPWTNKSR